MNFKKEAEKLLANKYFLYFIIFLSATNVLGYLVNYRFNSAIIFILIGLIMHQFSKNLVVVLLVALVITNMLAAMGGLREGLEGNMKEAVAEKQSSKETTAANNTDKVANNDDTGSTDPEVEEAISAIKNKVKQAQDAKKNKDGNVIYDHSTKDIDSNGEPVGNESFSSAGKSKGGKGPYIDHAATVEQSYQHLEDILGTDGIKNLTKDTQNLIEKQKKMYENIENMMPMVEQAQKFLGSFDIKQLNDMMNVAGGKN